MAFVRQLVSKIKSPEDLSRSLSHQNLLTNGVFTNGCFDILHKGHVNYLENARNLGDHLVVALNSDESVKRLKGPTRPINSLSDRLEVIAALEMVDYVTWFEADTPLELIKMLRPHILVKGGDWKVDQIVGSKEVIGWGGTVLSLPFIEGKSTTEIIKRSQFV